MESTLAFAYELGLAVASGVIVLGALLGLLLGVLLMVAPGPAYRLQDFFDRRFSLRQALKPFEVPRRGEPGFYRHHRIWGTLIVVGATVYILTWLNLDTTGLTILAPNPLGLERWLVESAEIFLTAGNVLALGVGLIVFFRPSLLKGLEHRANAWVSTRRWSRSWERESTAARAWSQERPRVLGALLTVGSLFVLASFTLIWTALGHIAQ